MKDNQILFNQLEDIHRKREDLMKTRIMISNQISAIKRRLKRAGKDDQEINDHTMALESSFESFKTMETLYEKQMITLVKQLPNHDWYCQFRGCSSTGYASLLAETGDLRNYENPAKVWKRMGLSVNGDRADKNETKGINTGYNNRRRMISFRISSAIVREKGLYRDVYDERKQYEVERNESGGNASYIEKYRDKMTRQFKSPDNKKLIQEGKLPKAVIDLRAHRYMVKKLLKDLWITWNNGKEMDLTSDETLKLHVQ